MCPESRHLAANTINQQLAAVRRRAHAAADSGLLSPELMPCSQRLVPRARDSEAGDHGWMHSFAHTRALFSHTRKNRDTATEAGAQCDAPIQKNARPIGAGRTAAQWPAQSSAGPVRLRRSPGSRKL